MKYATLIFNAHLVGTNGAGYELFAAVAGAEGSGIPLAFLYVQTTAEAAPGSKQAILDSFLSELKKLGVNPEFTLSDKDWSEINAMRAVWPQAKHQLCFWHALRALKQRLAKVKETPKHYDVAYARQEFLYIKASFVPAAQQDTHTVWYSKLNIHICLTSRKHLRYHRLLMNHFAMFIFL